MVTYNVAGFVQSTGGAGGAGGSPGGWKNPNKKKPGNVKYRGKNKVCKESCCLCLTLAATNGSNPDEQSSSC